jgi:hypothetical protein
MAPSEESLLERGLNNKNTTTSSNNSTAIPSIIQQPPSEVVTKKEVQEKTGEWDWSIRECPPEGESREMCKARLARIVTKQRECYRMQSNFQ